MGDHVCHWSIERRCVGLTRSAETSVPDGHKGDDLDHKGEDRQHHVGEVDGEVEIEHWD